MSNIDERTKMIVDYFIDEATKDGPELSADGMADFDRVRRLGALSDLLRARLPKELFRLINHLHDHKGILSVGVRCEPRWYAVEKIEKTIRVSWEDLNESEVDIFYSPPWLGLRCVK